MEAQKYQIVQIIGIIGEHKSTAEFIIELSNGCFISGGSDNIIKIYDKDFELLKEIRDIKESIYSCIERIILFKEYKNSYAIELLACGNKKLYQIFLSFKDKANINIKYKKYEFSNIALKTCVQMRENNYAIIGENSIYLKDFLDFQNINISTFKELKGKTYLNSIRINRNYIAITSNKIQDYGEDKLIFYNIEKNKISREIEGYSFISGTNGLALIPSIETKSKNKILLCACKRYFDVQKNGIYLANAQLEDKQGINDTFYDTGNFEVFCFCPILIINSDNDILEKGKEQKIEDTDYFFVGGFNIDRKEGEIKLFKVLYSDKAKDNKIEFVQNIEFERNKNFTGFEGAVNCIIQTKIENNGYILVTCYSGKVYLLTQPNLDYYLKTKNKEIKI